MDIERAIFPPDIIEKIKVKHQVDWWEAEEIFFNTDPSPLVLKSQGKYVIYGCTDNGRYLMVGFIYRRPKVAVVRTARDMTDKEKKLYKSKR